jgi:hypothetical protein
VLLTAPVLVTGGRRKYWGDLGFVAADMETAFLPPEIADFAAIRVVLDTPEHSIGDEWTRGARAGLSPRLLREGAWLAAHAPRYALRAAQVTSAALQRLERTSPGFAKR